MEGSPRAVCPVHQAIQSKGSVRVHKGVRVEAAQEVNMEVLQDEGKFYLFITDQPTSGGRESQPSKPRWLGCTERPRENGPWLVGVLLVLATARD